MDGVQLVVDQVLRTNTADLHPRASQSPQSGLSARAGGLGPGNKTEVRVSPVCVY